MADIKSKKESVGKRTKLQFEVEPFTYDVEFSENDGSVFIEAIHNGEYLAWANMIHETITSDSASLVDIKLTPEIIFEMLSDYCDKKLDSKIEIDFPQVYKGPKDQICIEFKFNAIPYGKKYVDTKVIILDSKPIEYEQRVNKKFDYQEHRMKEYIENKLTELKDNFPEYDEFEGLEEKINGIKGHVDNNQKSFDDKIKALKAEVTKECKDAITAAKTEIIKMLNDEINKLKAACDSKFAVKT